MKNRFSSLHIGDIAAWLLAVATFGALALAGLAIALLRKPQARPVRAPDLTPGI